VTFDAQVDFSNAPQGDVCVTSPFASVVRLSGRSHKPVEATPENVVKPHPIFRALEWERKLNRGEASSRAELAAQLGVSRAAVTQYLKLTKLAPEIIEWFKAVDCPEMAKKFSLRKLMRLSEMPSHIQRKSFQAMKRIVM